MAQASAWNTPGFHVLELPGPIRRALSRLDRRLRLGSFLSGFGTLLFVGALGVVLGMTFDFALALPGWLRLAIWGTWVAAIAVMFGRILFPRKSFGQPSPTALNLAALIERRFPGLGERLTASVGLVDTGGRHGVGNGNNRSQSANGSPALIAALIDEAVEQVGTINPVEAVSLQKAQRTFLGGSMMVALLGIATWLVPDPIGHLAQRFLNPWSGLERLSRVQIFVEPGNAFVAIGDDFVVKARVQTRFGPESNPRKLWLEWQDPLAKRTRRIAMEPSLESAKPSTTLKGKRTATIPHLLESITYRVVAESAESPRYTVNVVAPPVIASISARVVPPGYTKQAPFDAPDPAKIEALERSKVELTVKGESRIKAVEVRWPVAEGTGESGPESGFSQELATVGSDGLTGTVSFVAERSGPFSIRLYDPRGIKSRDESPRSIVVVPDAPPTVALRGVEASDEVAKDDTLLVGVDAADDFAVASVELHYSIVRGGGTEDRGLAETGKLVPTIDGLGTEAASGVIKLGLKGLKVESGDLLRYKVRVADNRPAPLGPNVTWSSDQELKIVADIASLAARREEAERTAIQERLAALKKGIAGTKKETEQLRYAADAARADNGKWEPDRRQSLVQQETEARAIAESLQKLAKDLESSRTFHSLARPAEQTARVEAEALRASLDRARQANSPVKRFNELQKADARTNDVDRKVDELQRQFDELTRRGADRQRLQELADRQQEIAEQAESAKLNPRDRIAFDKLQAEQNAVRNELDQLLQKSPELRAELLKTQADEAAEIAKKAKSLANRQREEASLATNLNEKKPLEALQAIAEEQRGIENEARRLAIDVNQALAENGRAPLNIDPLTRAIDPIERSEVVEGRERLRESERELSRLAREIQDMPQEAKALARRLFNAQQTLTNDLAQTLGEHRNKTEVPSEARANVQDRLKRLQDRADEVARLAAAIPESKEALAMPANGGQAFPRDLATKAADAAKKAAERLREGTNPQIIEKEATEAREALGALANTLPDHWKTEGDRRRAFDEARNNADNVANEVEKHLRETDRPNEGSRALDDLANRLAPFPDQARQAAEQLAKVEPGTRIEPLRDRAEARIMELGQAVEAARAAIAAKPGADDAQALRDRLANAVIQAKAATERFNQALQGINTDDKLADALAEEAKSEAPPKPGDRDQQAERNRMVSALRNVQALDAPIEHAEAVAAAERLATNTDPDPKQAEILQKASQRANQELADRLNDRQSPKGHFEAMARAERTALQENDPAAAAKLQKGIIAELADLAAQPADPKDDRAAALKSEVQGVIEAVRAAKRVAETVVKASEPGETSPSMAEWAKAQEEVAKAIDQLAGKLQEHPQPAPGAKPKAERPGKDLPNDPGLDLDPEAAKIAAELAARERRLAERLQSVLGERAAPQEALKREALALGRDVASLRDRSQSLSERAKWPAQETANLLNEQAPQVMTEAKKQLGEGQKDRARDVQRQAADLTERAARSAEDLAGALLAEKAAIDAQIKADRANAGASAAESKDGSAKPLADAREAMNQASRALQEARAGKESSRPAAKEAIQNAAKTLQAAAESRQQALAQSRESANPDVSTLAKSRASKAKDPKGGKVGAGKTETLDDLQALVQKKTGRAWGELPGHLRTEILEMARQPRYRDDYARLIQLYFREIAAGAK